MKTPATPGRPPRQPTLALLSVLILNLTPGAARADFAYRGDLELDTRAYFSPPAQPALADSNRALALHLDVTADFGDAVNFAMQPFLRRDFADDGRDAARLDDLLLRLPTGPL